METESYTIKMDGFEGPFGLLLELIEKRKLHINDISLASATEDFLAHMNKIGGLNPAQVSSFIVVASTLILIKSKSLLPSLKLTEEEEGDIRSLEERLRLYELFTRLADNVKANYGSRVIFSPLDPPAGRKGNRTDTVVFLPDDQITKDSMMEFAQGALGAMPKKVFLPEVEVRRVVSIEEMISKLTDRIQESMSLSFRDFHGKVVTRAEKVEAIVGFLAMLELVRKGIIDAVQEGEFGDILLQKQEIQEQN